MGYYDETKSAKILNLQSLEDIGESIFLKKDHDVQYYSTKKPENNMGRLVFHMETSRINIKPNVRQVNCLDIDDENTSYESFVIETKEKSTGIAVVLVKSHENRAFDVNIRILPLNTLSDIAVAEVDTKLLTLNLKKSKFVLKTDISIMNSYTGEALYSVSDVDVNAVSDLVTQYEIVQLKRELEFQGAKLMAHFFHEVMSLFESNTEQILELPADQLKKLLLANTIAGCIALEIVGSNVIMDLNKDWLAASEFNAYIIS